MTSCLFTQAASHSKKIFPFLLKSFAGIAQALPNVHLLLLGSGIQQYEEEIRSLVSELDLTQRVRLTGRIAYDQLPAYLAMCDIFVTASVTEVHPLSVIEAMGAGLPVMGIHSVGVGDTVQDGITGFLATHDQPAFTAKLTRLCLDLNLRAQMSDSARKASSIYAIERTTSLMLEHYKKLVREYKPRKGNWSVRLRRLRAFHSMTKYKKEIGAWGERIAADWLAERGYQIIARNVRTPYGEIDIIAQQGDVTIFIEVKTLTSSREFFPETNITSKQTTAYVQRSAILQRRT